MACKAMNCRGPSVRLVRSGLRSSLTRAHGADTGLDRMAAQGAAPKPATPLAVWREKQHTRPCTVSEESKAWRHGLDQHLPKGEIPFLSEGESYDPSDKKGLTPKPTNSALGLTIRFHPDFDLESSMLRR